MLSYKYDLKKIYVKTFESIIYIGCQYLFSWVWDFLTIPKELIKQKNNINNNGNEIKFFYQGQRVVNVQTTKYVL